MGSRDFQPLQQTIESERGIQPQPGDIVMFAAPSCYGHCVPAYMANNSADNQFDPAHDATHAANGQRIIWVDPRHLPDARFPSITRIPAWPSAYRIEGNGRPALLASGEILIQPGALDTLAAGGTLQPAADIGYWAYQAQLAGAAQQAAQAPATGTTVPLKVKSETPIISLP